MDPYSVSFAGNDLSVFTGIDLYNHDFNKLPKREIKINKLARRDLSIITSSEYSAKDIRIYMEVCGGSRADTEVLLTFIKALVQPQNGLLVVSQGGETTEYTATMNEFNYSWLGVQALVEIVFIASDPIGRNQDETTIFTLTGITSSTTSTTFEIGGSSTAYPLITYTLNTVTGATLQDVTILNARTNQGITINRTWANGDILTIDSDLLEARVNGAVVDFTGMFPQFETGANSLSYSDSFTTRSFDLTATYQARLV
jgi:hypothetical protein